MKGITAFFVRHRRYFNIKILIFKRKQNMGTKGIKNENDISVIFDRKVIIKFNESIKE